MTFCKFWFGLIDLGPLSTYRLTHSLGAGMRTTVLRSFLGLLAANREYILESMS